MLVIIDQVPTFRPFRPARVLAHLSQSTILCSIVGLLGIMRPVVEISSTVLCHLYHTG